MTVVRGTTHQVIKPGELFLYDSADPVTLCHGAQEQIGFIVDKSAAPALEKKLDALRFLVRHRNNFSVPLRNCLYFLSDRFMGNEVAAIVDAILSLLPFEAGLQQTESALRGQITELYSAIVAFIDENLQDPSLSAHEEAARELTFGRPRVTDLAYKWGFTDLSTFSRAFKEKFGCSPLEYRARY
jgi:hypothetical protein